MKPKTRLGEYVTVGKAKEVLFPFLKVQKQLDAQKFCNPLYKANLS